MTKPKPIALHGRNKVKVKSKQVGSLIKQAIKVAKHVNGQRWTQLRLADAVGFDKDFLNKMINGRAHIEVDYLSRISKVLKVGFYYRTEHGEIGINNNDTVDSVVKAEFVVDDIENIAQ